MSISRRGQLAIVENALQRQKILRDGGADPYGGPPPPLFPDIPELPDDPKQNLRWEREYLGFYLSDHPLNYVKGTALAAELGHFPDGKRVELVGIVVEAEVRKTRKGVAWHRFSFEDRSGRAPCFAFGEDIEVRDGYMGRLRGSVAHREEGPEIKVYDFKLMEEW